MNPGGVGVGTNGSVEIKMRKEGGVYLIPAKVNGIPMDFVFDTGASFVSISATEANFLEKNGNYVENPIDTLFFQDANGDINVGKVIVLNSIEVGSRTLYNVKATVVQNQNAPLLLGQSFLSQFGKVSIDYSKGIIELVY
jgi:aspartyl protease family protein